MTIGVITLTVPEGEVQIRLISDHQVEVEMKNTRFTGPFYSQSIATYKSYGNIPLPIRNALDASGRASAVENHMTCTVS